MNAQAQAVADIIAERLRQDTKFPNQHLLNDGPHVGLPPTSIVRDFVDMLDERGFGESNWIGVLTEEVCEAIDEAKIGDVVALRAELIQVAAVCVRWIEDLAQATS